MKKSLVLLCIAALLSCSITGCSPSTDTAGLQSQIAQLEKENQELKQQLQNSSQSASSNDAVNSNSGVESSASKPENEIKEISVGEKVSTSNYEFVINKVELSYDVLPENPPTYYTHYPAEVGQVYIHIDADIYNTGKQSLKCDGVYSAEADYDNGYKYTGFSIAEDTDGDFTYSNITSINPLQTLGVHCLINCPEVVETNKEAPLFVVIKLSDGSQYKCTIR